MFGTLSFREAQMTLSDPRCQPGAYIANKTRLCEIVQQQGADVIYVDCRSEQRWRASATRICLEWRLVRPAPSAPDTIPEAA